MAAGERLRVGVIDCGAGMFHLEGYAEEPRAEIVALAGLDTERCQVLAKRFEVPRIYGDYQDLLSHEDIDAVSVVVPNHLHLPVTLAALAAGKHVLVEKPLARNTAEGEQMVKAARDAGKVLAISFNRRHRHDMHVLKQHIEDGGLGRIYHARAFWIRRAGIPGFGTWFTNKEQSGGGPLIDLGVHVLDMALWLMGNPRVTAVSAATYAELGPKKKGVWPSSRFTVDPGASYEVEDLAVVFLRIEGGATLALETSWAAYIGATDEFGVTLMGTEGGAELHVKDYATVGTLRTFGDVGGVPADSSIRLRPLQGHTEVIHRFVEGVLNGTPVSPSGEEGLERVRLIDAIYHSAELGREVLVE